MNGSADLVESLNNSGTGVSWPKKDVINRGSHMIAHILLNLLNEFNEFNKT